MDGWGDHALAGVAVVQASASVLMRGRRHAARQVQIRGSARPASALELQQSNVDAWRCCRAVSRAAVLVPWRVRCLPAAFALNRLLQWRGVSSAVRLGVRTVDGTLTAHAWVECGGLRLDPLAEREPYEPLAIGQTPEGEPPTEAHRSPA